MRSVVQVYLGPLEQRKLRVLSVMCYVLGERREAFFLTLNTGHLTLIWSGGVAQLGERLPCTQEAIGSIPFTSTS